MGGGTESKSELPQWYVDYAKPSLDLANKVAQTGYRPSVGPEMSAFAPQQVQGMQQAADWSSAFNTPGQAAPDVASQLMQPNSSINGMNAFSSFPQYQESMDLFKKLFPGQAEYMAGFSIDPQTGAPASKYVGFPTNIAGGGGGGGGGGGSQAPLTPEQERRQRMLDNRGGNIGGGH